jgi:hypothetical protein
MSKVSPNDSLNENISLLEQKRAAEFNELKQQLRMTGESLKPANLLKGVVKDITGSSQFRSVLIKAGIGLALGFVANKLVTSKSHNKSHRMIGNALQYGISFLAADRGNLLKSAGMFAANSVIQAIRERRMHRRHLNNGVEAVEISES